ncbi:hypothetical protein [Streptomyces cadmiisoli]|uniref:hypothetical protein n=1 Tax=Streptomyces cadmiisoli TaxID=2184053 RepID=UPI003D731A6E
MTARVEILGDDGEWLELTGVTAVELHAERPEAEQLSMEQAVEGFMAWARQAAQQYARMAEEIVRTFNSAAAAAERFEQARRACSNRPAWQSPYGPPPRRR